MGKLKRLTPTDMFPGSAFFNKRADAIEAMGNLMLGGNASLTQAGNTLLGLPLGVKLVMFELAEDMQMPDPSGISVGDSSVPWTDNATAVWYTDYTSTQDYETDDTYKATLYHPTAVLNGSSIAMGHPTFFAGDRVWATAINGRWDIISQPDKVWRFELKDAMTPGGNATAYLLDKNGAEDTDQEFEVYDQVYGDIRAPVGAKGYAKFFADSERWEVIEVQRLAKHIEFTLGTALATTDASIGNATVNDSYDGIAPTGTQTVYNKAASSNYIFEGDIGDKGMAVLDYSDGHYKIWQMECP